MMKINNSLVFFIVLIAVLISGALLLNNGAKELSDGFSPNYNLAKPPSSSEKEVKVSAEHDSDKGLNITRLDDNVKFTDYASCLHPDYLKTYTTYPGILSKNNACVNKRMQHDILLQKLTTAEGSARLAKDKADMVQETLDYINAHENDDQVTSLMFFKGIEDTAYYEKASFSPQCLVQGGEKDGPKFAGMLKPKGDSSSAFVDSTPATQASKKSLLLNLEAFQNGTMGFLKKAAFGLEFIGGNLFDLYIFVEPEVAKKHVLMPAGLKTYANFIEAGVTFSSSLKCKKAGEVLAVTTLIWFDPDFSMSVAKSFKEENCVNKADKIKKAKDDAISKLKYLRDIQAKYEKQAVAYALSMKKLEGSDLECFNLPSSGEIANDDEETTPPATPPTAPAKPSSFPSYQNPIQSDYPVLY
ncbi:hypothetical protein HYW72_01075 [Candidatus Nomurabacteria bacterium]|nr:hypothetical protein [Candidatus Nomurabacteria bacterium]